MLFAKGAHNICCGEGDSIAIVREAFYVSQRKLEERRARVGRLEDERAAAAAQAPSRIVERAAEVVQEELAVLEQVEAEPARAPPPRRHGEDAELLCDVLRGLHGCYAQACRYGCVKRFEHQFLPSYVRREICAG